MSTAPNEEFDDEGNVVKVENLHFITGVLGQGAFGTVRLARRKLCPKTPSHPLTTQPATPFSEGKEKESFQENRKKHRQRSLHKSKSAPHEGSDFFSLPDEATTITTPSKPAHFERENTRRSPSVISNLGLFIRSRVSFDHDDDDEQLVAVKIFRKSILKRQRTMERDKTSHRVKIRTALEQVEREIALMKKLSHPNLVAMYEVIDSPESDMLYMVLEYMPLGEILTYQDDGTFRRKDPRPTSSKGQIDGIVNGYFNEEQAALYFVDILHGLAYLHQHHVCHRDLKPENILLGANGIAKVGDFGVSHIFDKESSVGVHRLGSANEDSVSAASSSNGESASEKNAPQQERRGSGPHPHNVLTRMDTDAALAMTGMAHYGLLTKTEGTWCFWSPEMCEGSQAFSGYAADMWAAGVCLYIFVTGRLPWYSEIPTDLFEMIGDAKIDYSGLGLSNSLIDLLKRCLEKCPGKRAGVGDCLKHPFLQVARAKRIKRLSTEFENSSKRKIVLNEDDIRAAFRIVTNVPVVLLKSASKGLREGSRKLQEGFAEARERLSLGDRKSTNSSSFDDGAPPPPSRHKVDTGKGFHGIRVRFPSLNSSNHSSNSVHRVRKTGFTSSRKSSMSSNDSTDHETTAEQKGLNDSASSFEEAASHQESPDSPVAIRTRRFNRVPSGLSSVCSFGSASGDELGIIFSEDDEYNETGDQENKTTSSAKKTPPSAKHPHITKEGSPEQLAGRNEAWVTPLSVQGKETSEMKKSFESDDGLASRDAKVEDPTSKGGRKKKAKKRQKKSKDKDLSKCLIQ